MIRNMIRAMSGTNIGQNRVSAAVTADYLAWEQDTRDAEMREFAGRLARRASLAYVPRHAA